jgi:hypothetical protein
MGGVVLEHTAGGSSATSWDTAGGSAKAASVFQAPWRVGGGVPGPGATRLWRVGGSGVRASGPVEVRRRFSMAPATTAFAMCGGAGFMKNRCLISETGLLISRVVRPRLF